MRGPSPAVMKRQRRNLINGRITRRPRNPPRPLQTRSRPLDTLVSVHQPPYETSLERETISDIYVEDHPISSNYNTCSTPGSFPLNKAAHGFQLAVDRFPNQRQQQLQRRHQPQPLPQPPNETQAATILLDDLRENFRSWGRNQFTLIQTELNRQAKIYERDFRLILDEHHFCDNFISYYFLLLVKRCPTWQHPRRRQKLVSINVVNVRRTIRVYARLRRIGDDVRFVLFPVRCVDNVECPWSLVIADMVNTKLIHYDPFQGRNTNHPEYKEVIKEALEDIRPRTRGAWVFEEAVVSFKCPIDDKPLSGLFICDFANSFVQYKPPTLREENTDLTILHLFDDICRGEIPLQAQRCRTVSDIRLSLVRFLTRNCHDLRQRVILRAGDIEMLNTDPLTLLSCCFLSPNVVNIYFILLQIRWLERREVDRNLPDLRVIRSTYSSHFIDGTKTMEMIFRETCHGGVTYFPVCDPVSNQWALLVIDEPSRTISYYNPRWNQEDIVPLYVNNMSQRYNLFAGFELTAWTDIPAVVNRYDSGIYVCRYGRELVESMPLDEEPFSDLSLHELRKTMREELRTRELVDIQMYHRF